MCQKGQFEDDMQGTSKCLTRACAFASSLDIVHDVPHIMYDWLEGSTKNEYVHVPLPCMYSYTHTCLIWLAIKNTKFLLVQKLCMPLQPKIEGTGLLGVQDAQKQITRRNFTVEKPAASYYPFCHIYV